MKDLTGKKINMLTAIRPVGKKYKKTVWLCKCDCGNFIEVVGTSLSSGNTKSCGCLREKHGMFGTRIYNLWHTMKERCYTTSATSYENYGAKGIKVCDEWHSFVPFMEWAYSNGYDESAPRGMCTLDRIDPRGDYCPENCRWVDFTVQANNKTNNVYIEYNGIVDTLSNHSRNVGLSPTLVESRKINGDSTDRMFRKKTEPKTIEYMGEIYKINDFCKKFKVSRHPLERRIYLCGESAGEALINIRKNKKRSFKRNRKVYQYDKNMNFIREWENLNEISAILGYNCSAIGNCCLGYSKTSNGFIWSYVKKES